VFVGREREMEAMNKLYLQRKFQMVVLYGRRRVGKTTLISKFIEGKPAIFYTAQEANDTINLAIFSKKVYRFFEIPETTGPFTDWNSAFEFLAEKAKVQQFVLAFDEFPYAAGVNKALKSILQNCIDHELKDTGLYLILCGSHVGFMENEVLGYKSPLFGRRTSQLKLEGFDYYDAAKMLESFSVEDKIKIYSCLGGTPHYLAQINADESFEENIKRLYFDISGYLYNEPMMLLQQELREPAVYNSIVSTIASGASRLNDISNKINEDSSKVIKYIQTLINLQIIKKEYAFGEDPSSSRKGIYALADYCYHFWYRFVFPNIPEIESGYGDLIADSEVLGEKLSAYVGKPAFEDICKQYMSRLNKAAKLPITATSRGSWWGNDPKLKQQADFDLVFANRQTKQIIVGECKWKNSLEDVHEIRKLMDKTHLLPEYNDRWYYFLSKAPFSEKAQQMAGECERLNLVTAEMLFDNEINK
jgi:AAA+ ATPase superfamily predicted ATPase